MGLQLSGKEQIIRVTKLSEQLRLSFIGNNPCITVSTIQTALTMGAVDALQCGLSVLIDLRCSDRATIL